MNLRITMITLLTCLTFYAQNFKQIQLPTPDKMNEFYVGPLFKSTIHYGATPPNYNGKVILFTHGYLDLNQTHFLFENSFYEEAYSEGYQTAFVATTRGLGVLVNGGLLAESIDLITDKYNVPDLDIIAHSNGARSSEVAMYTHNKKDKVKLVFALGTPFWGTELADFSQEPYFNWIWRLTGQNDGAATSTTEFCKGYRNYYDSLPNNEPEKFISYAVSAYYNGSNPIVRPILTLTGKIIKLRGGGVNDGIAPYDSTLRPGASIFFVKSDPRAMVDHVDISAGQFSWQYIKPFLDDRSLVNRTPKVSFESKQNKKAESKKIESDYYIIHSENKNDRIILDKNSNFAVAEIFHEDATANFTIKDEFGNKVSEQKKYQSQNHKTTIPFTKNNLLLSSTSKFTAFIKQSNGVTMSLKHQKKNTNRILKVNFSNQATKDISLHTVQVRAILTKTATLFGKPLEETSQIITFEQKNNNFFFDTKHLEDGIYSILITGESDQNFKRNIVSGFVIGDIKKALANTTNDTITPSEKEILISPNTVKEYAILTLKGYTDTSELLIKVYDITGKEIKKFTTRIEQNTTIDISTNIQSLSSGMYILQINNEQSVKFVKE